MTQDAGGTRRILLDGMEEMAEYDALSGTRAARYSHDPARIDSLLGQQVGATKVHAVSDALGSVYGLTNSASSTVSSYGYDVYGTRTSSAEGVATKFGFTGRVHDGGGGEMYYRMRYLSAGTGRFTQSDPALVFRSFSGTRPMHAYSYVAASPTVRIDPSGMIDINFAGGFVHYSEHPGFSADPGFELGPIDLTSDANEASLVYQAANIVRERMSVDWRCRRAFTTMKTSACSNVDDGTAQIILNDAIIYKLYNWEEIGDVYDEPGKDGVVTGWSPTKIPRPPYIVSYGIHGLSRGGHGLAGVLIHELAHHAQPDSNHEPPGPDYVVAECGLSPWW